MPTKKTAQKATKHASRRVTVPAGMEYIVFNPKGGEKAYLLLPNESLPADFEEVLKDREAAAYTLGYQEATDALTNPNQAAQGVMESPEELIKSILPRIRTQDVKDQNRVVAIVLAELQVDRENFMDHLQKQHDQAQERLGMAKANYEGFIAVRNGGFENLNFR